MPISMGAERVFSGRVWNGESFEDGFVSVEDGILKEVVYGEKADHPCMEGCILPGAVDTHTHVADSGLRIDRRYGLEELVAPPNGIKHVYLRGVPAEKLVSDMRSYSDMLIRSGVSRFIDFREGGVEGARMLRSASDRAVILGRPVSETFDPNEMDRLLDTADGVGIPSISDMDSGYVDAIADAVHRRGKMLALHVSERVREDIDRVMSLEPDLVIHMSKATDSDFRTCADRSVPISVCPTSNLYFGIVPPVGRMVDAGVDISLGTDNGMLFPSADIFEETRVLAGLFAKQGKSTDRAFSSLLACGHKVLYHDTLTVQQTGNRADIVVFPCKEEEILLAGAPMPVRCGP